MPSIVLSDPVNGTVADADVIANNNSLLEILLNAGLDGDNVSASAILTFLRAVLTGNGGKATLDLSNTTADVGITIGGDVVIYRSAADVLKTDDSLVVVGTVSVVGNRGTSLPASPVDGMEYVLTDHLTAPTYNWKFRYNAGSASAYKWEFVGGSPLSAYVETSETTSSTSFVDLATVGPSVTAPRAGEYRIAFGATVRRSAGAGDLSRFAPKLGAAAAADLDGIDFGAGGGTSDDQASIRRELRLKTLAAADVVKLQYLVSPGTATGTFQRRELSITPIRVS